MRNSHSPGTLDAWIQSSLIVISSLFSALSPPKNRLAASPLFELSALFSLCQSIHAEMTGPVPPEAFPIPPQPIARRFP